MTRRSTPAILASILSLESDDTPMHIAVLLRFEKPADAAPDFLTQIAASFRRQGEHVAPWHWRLKRAGLRPQWQECASVDFDHHFRQIGLPTPGGEKELGILVSRLHSQLLDMTRPPWECYLIEGLEKKGFALYLKVHRALVDVAGGAEVLYAFLNSRLDEAGLVPPWHCSIDSEDLKTVNRNELTHWPAPVNAVTGLGRAFGRLLSAGLKKGSALAVPYKAPRTALNGPVNRQRRFATQQYSAERVSRVCRQLGGCDENVVLLYLCGSALRRFLKEFNALPDEPLIAAVPQSRVFLSDFSLAFVSLASDQANPLERFAAVNRSYEAALDHLANVSPKLRMAYSLTASAPFIAAQVAGAQPWLPAMFNLSFINMPGPDSTRYLGGAELKAVHHLSMLMPGTALSINCSRYRDTVNLGLTGARDTLPHLQRIAVYMGLALDSLEDALGEQLGESVA